jgi:hypothetical protein
LVPGREFAACIHHVIDEFKIFVSSLGPGAMARLLGGFFSLLNASFFRYSPASGSDSSSLTVMFRSSGSIDACCCRTGSASTVNLRRGALIYRKLRFL